MPLSGTYEPRPSQLAREHVERFEASGGVLEEYPGRHGHHRDDVHRRPERKIAEAPRMRVEHDGEYAVVASLGGAPKHPVWYHNLKQNPHVELQDGPVKRDYLAREVTGEEKAVWWERAVAAYPDYADYQKKTTREIPVFVLTPMTEAEDA